MNPRAGAKESAHADFSQHLLILAYYSDCFTQLCNYTL
jgi:hypothetical protein